MGCSNAKEERHWSGALPAKTASAKTHASTARTAQPALLRL
jgi:hypothetical protein